MHFVVKMFLLNREVRYQIHSGSRLAGSGSKMIYSGSDSGSGSGKSSGSDRIQIRIRIHNTVGNGTDGYPLVMVV